MNGQAQPRGSLFNRISTDVAPECFHNIVQGLFHNQEYVPPDLAVYDQFGDPVGYGYGIRFLCFQNSSA